MSTSDDQSLEQLRMDAQNLYREEVFTDRRVGTIQRMTPVTAEGQEDDSRSVFYLGQTQVMTPMGALPLNFELAGQSLQEAMDGFPQAARQALDQAMEELQEMQRESSSRIVTPDSGGGGGQGGGMSGGFRMR